MNKAWYVIATVLLLLAQAGWGLVVIDDDFEIYSNGSQLGGQAAWLGPDFSYSPPDSVGPTIVTSPVSGGSRAARWECMQGTDVKSATLTNYFPAEWTNGTAVMYVDVAMDATDGPASPYGNFSYFIISDGMGNEATRIYLRRNGGTTGDIHLLGRTGGYTGSHPLALPNIVVNPENNTYYKIKLDIDITNRKYDAYVGDGDRSGVNEGHWGSYVDGELVLDGVPAVDDLYFYYPATGLAKFTWLMYRFGGNFSGPSYAYMDNLYIEGPDDALGIPCTEIWVAKGTYTEKVTLPEYTRIYGGFAGNENSKYNRTGQANETIINAGDSSVGASAITGGSVTTIDGFTIAGGYYGVSCGTNSIDIVNNLIVGNAQAGVYCNASSPDITNNTIVANNLGIDCSASSPIITSNIIMDNAVGVSASGGTPSLANNDVYGNTTDYSGVAAGSTDISQDPKFVDSASGDYHLLLESPCIDAGSTTTLIFDKDGGWRVVDGDGDGTAVVDMGAFEFQASPVVGLPGGLKALAGQTTVRLNQMVVTKAWTDYFYVEDDAKATGIRVEKARHGLTEGMRADVIGVLEVNDDDELYVEAAVARQNGAGTLGPVAFAGKNVGGAGHFYDPIAGTGQRGLSAFKHAVDLEGFPTNVQEDLIGVNNIGLLVRLWGKVVQDSSSSFYVDDGSGYSDGDPLKMGVKIVVPAGVNPAELPERIQVTGISSCYKTINGLFRQILVADPDDIAGLE